MTSYSQGGRPKVRVQVHYVGASHKPLSMNKDHSVELQ